MGRAEETAPDAPLTPYRTEVRPEWVDYNGHMSEAYYVRVFGFATDALLDPIGMDAGYRERSGMSVYTLEAHVSYLREVREGEPLRVTTQLLDLDHKRAHVFHAMRHGTDGRLLATEEVLLIHVHVAAGRSAPFAPEILSRLETIRKAHASLPKPQRAGRSIVLKR